MVDTVHFSNAYNKATKRQQHAVKALQNAFSQNIKIRINEGADEGTAAKKQDKQGIDAIMIDTYNQRYNIAFKTRNLDNTTRSLDQLDLALRIRNEKGRKSPEWYKFATGTHPADLLVYIIYKNNTLVQAFVIDFELLSSVYRTGKQTDIDDPYSGSIPVYQNNPISHAGPVCSSYACKSVYMYLDKQDLLNHNDVILYRYDTPYDIDHI